jgi:hypothetical protein
MAIVSRNSVRVACTPATVVSTTEFAPDRVDRLADALVGTGRKPTSGMFRTLASSSLDP